MESLGQDVRFALRRLLKTPAFTLAALLTLALGIGANSALFSVLDAVVLQPLPFREPDRLYALWSRHTSTERYPFQLPEYCDYRDQNQTLEATAAIAVWSASLASDGPTERLTGVRVSANLFDLLGTQAALGRTLRPEDDGPGREKVVVLSHGLWRRRFGGDSGVLGRSLQINGELYEVVGVLGPRFLFPLRDVDLAVPLAPEKDPWRLNRDSTSFLRMLARARPGVTPAQIASDLDAIGRRLRQQFPESYARKQGVTLLPLNDELTRTVRPALLMLQGAVAVLLLIACANLANLMLVRGSERRRELAIRSALGAGHGRLARELLVESVLLACAGGALGLLLAWAPFPRWWP